MFGAVQATSTLSLLTVTVAGSFDRSAELSEAQVTSVSTGREQKRNRIAALGMSIDCTDSGAGEASAHARECITDEAESTPC